MIPYKTLSAGSDAQPLTDFYRCPNDLINLKRVNQSDWRPGYFYFGPEIVCYGNSPCGSPLGTLQRDRSDVLEQTRSGKSGLRLPFNLGEVVGNFQRERYRQGTHGKVASGLESRWVQKLYYAARPALGVSMRKHLQRLFLRNWAHEAFPQWPVDTTVEQTLERVMLLAMQAGGIDRVPFIWFWPNGANGCITVTHDVETQAGMDSCLALADLDDSFGFKSSFQLVPWRGVIQYRMRFWIS